MSAAIGRFPFAVADFAACAHAPSPGWVFQQCVKLHACDVLGLEEVGLSKSSNCSRLRCIYL